MVVEFFELSLLGLWTLDFGPWTLNLGLSTLDFRLLTLDYKWNRKKYFPESLVAPLFGSLGNQKGPGSTENVTVKVTNFVAE